MSEPFKASVQYNDWIGTAAADNADGSSVWNYLRDKGELVDGEHLVSVQVFIGENFRGQVQPPSITAVILPKQDGVVDVDAFIATHDGDLPTRTVDIDVNL